MDPIQALREIFQQLNELSGAGLDLIDQALGGAEGGGGEGSDQGGETPAAENAEPVPPGQ